MSDNDANRYEVYFTPEMVETLYERRDQFETELSFGARMLKAVIDGGRKEDLRLYLDLDCLLEACKTLKLIPRCYHIPFALALRELDFIKCATYTCPECGLHHGPGENTLCSK